MAPARAARTSRLRCQLIPPSQTGHLVLYQTTRSGTHRRVLPYSERTVEAAQGRG